jgi:hypothetical protein
MDGEPADPTRISCIVGRLLNEVVAEEGTKVIMAKRKCIIVTIVGGSCSSTIKIATTSHNGHEVRIVVAIPILDFC